MNKVEQESQPKTVPQEIVDVSGLGQVARYVVEFEGSLRTVYSTGLKGFGLEKCLKDIVSAEESAKSPIIVGINGGKTPKQFIEDESNGAIKAYRSGKLPCKEKPGVLDPLVDQKIMEKLFNEAKSTQ